MRNTARDNIEALIKGKESFSIPMIQIELGLDYGEVREVVGDLVEEEKVEFLEGIVYKWVESKEEKDDDDDSSEDDHTSWLDAFLNDDDDDKNNDKDKEKEKDDDPLDFDSFLKSIMSINSINAEDLLREDDTDWDIDDIGNLTKSKGGPLPEISDEVLPLFRLISDQRDYDPSEGIFRPMIDVSLPGASEPLDIHVAKTEEDESRRYFHDGGKLTEYIRSLAEGLESSTVNGWQKLIEKWIPQYDLHGIYEDGLFKYYVSDTVTYELFHRAIAYFITDIMKVVGLINTLIIRYRECRVTDGVDRFDLSEHLLKSNISFESIPEFIEKILELEPEANADTINHVFFGCAMSAIRQRHPKKREIMDLSKKGRDHHGAPTIIYLIMKDVKKILETQEGGEE